MSLGRYDMFWKQIGINLQRYDSKELKLVGIWRMRAMETGALLGINRCV